MPFQNILSKGTAVTLLSIAIAIAVAGCDESDLSDASSTPDTAFLTNDDDSSSAIDTTALDTLSGGDISPAEKAGLLFMREEEKLARDVYLTLYDTWTQQIFQNIANSEQTHTDAMLTLLAAYDIPDPVGSNPIGVFVDSDLQSMYDSLVIQGYASLIDALQVGAAIEEIDIIDIERRKEEVIGNDDIIETYDMLLKGSRNHLRAFVKNLANQGIDYQPQYLTQAEYDAIIGSDAERGN